VTVVYVIVSIFINVAIYAYLGSIIGRMFRRGHGSTPGGT